MRWKLHSVRSNGCKHVELCESIMHQSFLSLPSERFCSLLHKIKYMKTRHTKTRVISIKIAVVAGNGSSRRLAPDTFGAVALGPSGGESLSEVREFYCLSLEIL